MENQLIESSLKDVLEDVRNISLINLLIYINNNSLNNKLNVELETQKEIVNKFIEIIKTYSKFEELKGIFSSPLLQQLLNSFGLFLVPFGIRNTIGKEIIILYSGSDDDERKYLKYKSKYLQLKQFMKQ
jgi:hypothetical protein